MEYLRYSELHSPRVAPCGFDSKFKRFLSWSATRIKPALCLRYCVPQGFHDLSDIRVIVLVRTAVRQVTDLANCVEGRLHSPLCKLYEFRTFFTITRHLKSLELFRYIPILITHIKMYFKTICKPNFLGENSYRRADCPLASNGCPRSEVAVYASTLFLVDRKACKRPGGGPSRSSATNLSILAEMPFCRNATRTKVRTR